MVPWTEPRAFCRSWNTCPISGSSSMTAGAMANPARRGQPAVTGAARRRPARTSWVTNPTTVVAHSFGCVVAVSAAIQHPGRFRGLGLWEPQVPWMEFWPGSVRRGLEAMAAEADTDALAERVYVSMVGEEAWRRLPEELKARGVPRAWPFRATSSSDSVHHFAGRTSKVPSLFGVGLETWPFAQEAATRLAESLGAELFTIEGAGHSAHVSHPRNLRSSCAAARPFDPTPTTDGSRTGYRRSYRTPATSASQVAGVTPCSRSARLRTRPTGLRGSSSRNSM